MARALLVNPWIHDFALYDLWMKPVGLLLVADLLRRHGVEVDLLDCLDRLHPQVQTLPRRRRPRHDPHGCGKFASTVIPTPAALAGERRPYRRYGVPPELLAQQLPTAAPDVLLVTSGMTYWYPGVVETIAWLRDRFPDTPVLLGGVYASLHPEHARHVSGAEVVLPGWQPDAILASVGVHASDTLPPAAQLRPAWDLLPRLDSATTFTRLGCPFRCDYCASPLLWPTIQERPAANLIAELQEFGEDPRVADVAFLDDALLLHATDSLFPALSAAGAATAGLQLQTPNAVHACYIDREVATLMRESHFYRPRLGLETASDDAASAWGGKISRAIFREAAANLQAAGYAPGEVEAYVMAGLPEQTPAEVEDTLRFAHAQGVVSRLARYSPVPGTPGYRQLLAHFPALADEPLLENNTLLNRRKDPFSREVVEGLRALSAALNAAVRPA